MQQLLSHLQNFNTLSAGTTEILSGCFEKILLSKNKLLLREGRVCTHLYFLEKGALRGFYNLDGKEITHWFGFEKDFVTSFHSFITGEAAVENIQLLENSTLLSISKETLTELLNRYHDIERLVRITYEKY